MENIKKLHERYAKFYEEYYSNAVKYVTSKIQNHYDAEDIVSDIFTYCYEHFSEYDETKSSIQTWLYVIINSRIKNYYRDKKISVDFDSLENILPESESDMEKSIYLEELRKTLKNALSRLSERERRIVILKYFQNKSSVEIAEEMKMTAINVRVTLSRALKKLALECAQFGSMED